MQSTLPSGGTPHDRHSSHSSPIQLPTPTSYRRPLTLKDCWLSCVRKSRLYSARYCRIAHECQHLWNGDSLSPSYALNTLSNTSCNLPVTEYPVISSHMRLQCHDSPTLFHISSTSIIILVHSSTVRAIHHNNHHNHHSPHCHPANPSANIDPFNNVTITQIPYHYFPHAGTLGLSHCLDHHGHHSQHCVSHRHQAISSNLSPAYSTWLLSSSTSLLADLQHASIHALSCTVVHGNPCSRCLSFTNLSTGGSTVAAG